MDAFSLPLEQQLCQQIRFKEEDGQIWFDEQRMLLLQLIALAEFRKEQIDTLGQERAKGFFMRLGYSMGKKDAQLALRLSNSKDPHDLIRTGFGLHSLKGMVRIDEQRLEVDQESGHFYAEYVMHDSYEAEMFLTELGRLNEPVCWSLVGQASAFTSALLGREIIFKEITCRGCGDSSCLIVGKPAEEWEDVNVYREYFRRSSVIEELYELQSQISVLRHKVDKKSTLGNFRGQSPGYQQICKLANRAAEANVTVLLLGETGVGKELVARAIHDASKRNDNQFVAVNCAAIPPDLIESELFGVEKGAFTGATQSRPGKFERAHMGTIFLDEVIELSPRAQAALLRVLQEGELERVGDSQTRNIDVRVVAATNESLEEAVKEGRFRADLYYRLNVYPINIPPLRERPEDLPMLIEHFLEKYHAYYSKRTAGVSGLAMQAMMKYEWPGNVRELENLIERALILTDNGEEISASTLFPTLGFNATQTLSADGHLVDVGDEAVQSESSDWIENALGACESLEEIEQKFLDYALDKANGNVSEAARVLGISRPTLAYRMKKMEEN
ncbi:sigma 54-interacting transcriptional regulator [Neptuniibacter sp.]|uniref:sigma 54-interacting transcriptional regulator n=1 Tax=Neptuniibacter sp. TaxID=1962643 RepID=UPI003B598582